MSMLNETRIVPHRASIRKIQCVKEKPFWSAVVLYYVTAFSRGKIEIFHVSSGMIQGRESVRGSREPCEAQEVRI